MRTFNNVRYCFLVLEEYKSVKQCLNKTVANTFAVPQLISCIFMHFELNVYL